MHDNETETAGAATGNRLAAAVDVYLTSAAVDWTTAEGFAVQIYYTVAGQIS